MVVKFEFELIRFDPVRLCNYYHVRSKSLRRAPELRQRAEAEGVTEPKTLTRCGARSTLCTPAIWLIRGNVRLNVWTGGAR